MDEQPSGRAADGTAGVDDDGAAVIGRLAARLRGARRGYAIAAGVLVAVGLGVAAAGLSGLISAPLPFAIVGLLAAALAALPWCQAWDRRDRADGLGVLAEEWAALPPGDAEGRTALLRLVGTVCGGGGGGGSRRGVDGVGGR